MSFINGLKKINKAVDRKIKKLQRSDKSTKKKWLIGSSITFMIFILFMWVGYLNFTLPEVETETSQPVVKNSDSFFETVYNGASILYTKIESEASSIINKVEETFQRKREFEFSN